MPERVLITGARAPAALDLARSYAAAGCEVHMADCVPARMARWSRATTRVHRYPSPRSDPAGFKRGIEELVRHVDPVLVVPACEEVFHLAAQPVVSRILFAPPLSNLRRLHSKFMFAEDCAAIGIPAPATSRVASAQELEPFAERASDFVFKPEYSRFGTRALIGPETTAARKLLPSSTTPWVAQARVKGTEVSFYAVSDNSRLVAFSAYQSTWRFNGGAGYAFAPLKTRASDQLREIAETIAKQLVSRGQFACDAIIDAASQPWLIECNPRATSGVHLFSRHPDLALAMLGRKDTVVCGTTQSTHVGLALWWYGMRDALKHKRLRDWHAQRKLGVDVIGGPGDRAPVFGALADTMLFGTKALAKGSSLAEVMTADIEWNGEEL